MLNRHSHFALVVTLLLLSSTTAAQSSNSMTLLATQAKLSGPSVRMNNDTQVAAWWKSPTDQATWRFKVEKPRKVDVLLIYGVPEELANQSFIVEVGGIVEVNGIVEVGDKAALTGKVPGTGGYANFRQQAIGTLQLAAGEHRLTFRPAQAVQGDDLLDLRAVVLASHDPSRKQSTVAPTYASVVGPDLDMLKTIRVPNGFSIEQVAGPPLVERPISVDFDELGRLYVTESNGTNDKVDKQLAETPHRVLRLEDVDGDGVFDKRTVFADRMMLPEGALWHRGSLYVAAPPHIWKLTDINDDGVADKREVWFEGTLGGCANDLHGPYLGPEGWIYWCKGEFATQTYERPGRSPLVTRAAHIFRRHPSGGPVEVMMTGGMNNPVDVAFTPGGERIFTTTFLQLPAGGKRDGLIHAVYGGVYPRKNGVLDGHPRTGELMPILTHMGVAAPCGLIRLDSSQLGDGFRDNLLACQFNTHKVSRHVLARRGASFITQDEDFVTSDHVDFHPTDVLEDADGSVLVVNTGGWYMLCCPTSRLHKPNVLGGIYRVRRDGRHVADDPRGHSIEWATLSADQLAGLLADRRPAVRRRALEQLVTQNENAIPSLNAILKTDLATSTRLNAVWALTRIDHPNARAVTRTALADNDELVRQAAIHGVAVWRDSMAITDLLRLLSNPSLHNRRAAAEAIGRIGDTNAIDHLLAAAADYQGRVLDHSLVYAMIELGDERRIRGGLAAESPHTRRAAMLALDNLPDGQLQPDSIVRLLNANDSQTADAAWWITQRHPEWADEMVDFFRNEIQDPAPAKESLESLSRYLAKFSESPKIQTLLANSLAIPTVPRQTKLAILNAIATSHVKEVPQQWSAALADLLTHEDNKLVAASVRAVHAHLPSPLVSELQKVAFREGLTMETRLRALASHLQSQQQTAALDDSLFRMLAEQISAARPVRNRSLAIDAILNARLSDDQLSQLTERLADTSSMDLIRLLTAFESSTSPQIGENLVAALNDAPAATALDSAAVERILRSYGSVVSKQAEPLLKKITAASQQKSARFDAVLKLVNQADVRRGQEVFYGTKAACSACHSIGYRGGNVGPDLTSIGRIRNAQSLLESILYPSSSFVQSYEPITIHTNNGVSYSGVITEENTNDVVLSLDAEKRVRIRTDEIEARMPGTVSIMPTGLEEQLTPNQLADLLVFLMSVK